MRTRGQSTRPLPPQRDLAGSKGSVFYLAHSYHTKVPPEGIVGLIEHFTEPGGVVADPFCGSGMTGVACRVSGRQAMLSDLSPAAVHIASGFANQVGGEEVLDGVGAVVDALVDLEHELYDAEPIGERIEYTIWSDVFDCPSCQDEMVFWDAGLTDDRKRVRDFVHCDNCQSEHRKRDLVWARSEPVAVSVHTGSGRVQRELTPSELELARRPRRAAIEQWFPTVPFEASREMWRGQHRDQGIDTAADFFTDRNLLALAALWDRINGIEEDAIRVAGRFVFTAIVPRASRRYQWNPKRPTNVLSSTLYLASLSYEWNVFSLFRRKLRAVARMYDAVEGTTGGVVVQAPAQQLSHLDDGSVDYVFCDPPFGSNIFYGDASFLWDAWLGESTDLHLEAVVNKSVRAADGGKTVADYEKLMTEAFAECRRVLRPDGWMSVMFHNSSDEVWSCIQRAISAAGFVVDSAVPFDKNQPSFKGIKGITNGERVADFDLVMHLRPPAIDEDDGPQPAAVEQTTGLVLDALRSHLASAPPRRRSTPYLHSLAMRVLLEANLSIDGVSYEAVEKMCHDHFIKSGTTWHLSEDVQQ